jgi:hypothetical protein
MQLWMEHRGNQGGTIHDALRDFKALPMAEKDRFCGILVDNLSRLTDAHHARDFMQARNASVGLVVSGI